MKHPWDRRLGMWWIAEDHPELPAIVSSPTGETLTYASQRDYDAMAGKAKDKPAWSAESFGDLDEDVRQSIRRIQSSPFIPHTDAVRGFVFDVATGRLNEVK